MDNGQAIIRHINVHSPDMNFYELYEEVKLSEYAEIRSWKHD